MLTSHEADNFNVAVAENTKDLFDASSVGNWLVWSRGRWIGTSLLLGSLVAVVIVVGGGGLIGAVSAPMACLAAFEACIVAGVKRWLIMGLLVLSLLACWV